MIGQTAVVRRLRIAINACRKLNEPMSHILFDGPPGLGKTTFATVLHNELGKPIQLTSGPALTKPMDLMPFLTNATEGSILFIDKIVAYRMVEEFIYPGHGRLPGRYRARRRNRRQDHALPLQHFTLVGATTRSGMLSSPMHDRFKQHEHLEFYTVDELAQIVRINAAKLETALSDDAAVELADVAGELRELRTRACGGRRTA